MRNIFFAALISLSAAVANAGLLNVGADFPTVEGAPAGFIVNDVLIDFEGQLTSQQIVLQLDSGTVFNELVFGNNTAPNGALVAAAPTILADSFVGIGGRTSAESQAVLVPGASTDLGGPGGAARIDEQGADITFAPNPGIVVDGGMDYFVSRLTLSEDANGLFLYAGSAGGDPLSFFQIPVVNGQIIPEPTTVVLAGLAGLGFFARRK